MKLSVIILNYNVRYFLELCILSVQKSIENIDAEIILVDNNSPDDSCEMIKQRFPNLKLIENKENSGFPKGNNIGVAAAKGEYICILNPDTVVAEDTFEKILAFAGTQKDIGIIGCKLIDGTGNFLLESKRGIPTPFAAFAKITGLYKLPSGIFGKYYASHLSENQTGKVDILVGAFMLMKRDLYIEVGGFDEDYFMYGEDIDLSYRILKKGKFNYYFHETSVIHYKGESTVKDEKYRKRFRDGMDIFYKKHFSRNIPGLGFFSFFMKTGMVFFSLAKTFQGKPKPKSKPEKYFLVSDNEILRRKLREKLKSEIVLLENAGALPPFSKKNQAQLIFDNNFIGFKPIIKAFEHHKNQNITFRILPKSTGFIIGSDSNLDRGEVVQI
jgi:GT2 family glycosyltransferase